MQKRQSNSKSRSEKFNPHPEEASGFPIDPPRPSQGAERTDSQVRHPKKASHSGPLAQRAAWVKASKNPDDAPKISTGADTFTTSGLVAPRRSMLGEKSDASQGEVKKLIGRFPGSFKETSESSMLPDQKFSNHSIVGSHDKERCSTKDPIVVSMRTTYFTVPSSAFFLHLP